MGQAKMHVGVQGIGTSKMELQFLTRHGVTHMDAQVDGNDADTFNATQARSSRRRHQFRDDSSTIQRAALP